MRVIKLGAVNGTSSLFYNTLKIIGMGNDTASEENTGAFIAWPTHLDVTAYVYSELVSDMFCTSKCERQLYGNNVSWT